MRFFYCFFVFQVALDLAFDKRFKLIMPILIQWVESLFSVSYSFVLML
jgi:hypothetical protein